MVHALHLNEYRRFLIDMTFLSPYHTLVDPGYLVARGLEGEGMGGGGKA